MKLFNKKSTLEPKPLVIDKAPQQPSDNYRELAKKAGFEGVEKAISVAKMENATDLLRRFLSESGLAVYEDLAVRKYMNSITPTGKEWVWVCTRSVGYDSYIHRWSWERMEYREERGREVYSKPIPEAVLITMGKIREQFSGAVFEITDIRDIPVSSKLDPFLRVTVDGANWFIIERWDEPKFRQ